MSLRALSIAAVGLVVALAVAGTADGQGQAPGPRVRSRTLAQQQGGIAADPFDSRDLSSTSPYDPTTFFGLKARGKLFVFVIDCSGSMGDGRLARAKSELRRTIASLRFPQQFLVIFYNDQARVMPGGVPRSFDANAFARLEVWMSTVEAFGGTEPRDAMRMALGLHPDAVFLLSDGEYPRGAVESILGYNAPRATIPIHCVNLGGAEGSWSLRRIAERSGGHYADR